MNYQLTELASDVMDALTELKEEAQRRQADKVLSTINEIEPFIGKLLINTECVDINNEAIFQKGDL